MIRIRTGSRLHFGLFSIPSEQAGPWLNQEGEPTIPRRQFGGVGLMIDKPGIELTVEEAPAWSAEGPLAERALQFAHTYCAAIGAKRSFKIRIEHAPPEHAGLGTGTQLGLAVAAGLARLTGQWVNVLSVIDLAQKIGRGRRSAIGIHGFERGGFLIEAGKTPQDDVSPLIFGLEFPSRWGILLILPRGLQGAHGRSEIEAFAELSRREPDDRATEALCRIVLLGMLPALAQFDLGAFGEALFDFNRRSGAMFKSAQGGIYSHPRVEQIVKTLREFGVKGVGQSSWGPAIFAIISSEEVAAIRDLLIGKQIIAKEEAVISDPLNCGIERDF